MKCLNVKCKFDSEVEKKTLVEKCEREFEEQIENLRRTISTLNDVNTIMLSGPTCSGKTTICENLIKLIEKSGKHAKLVSIDDFFKEREDLDRNLNEYVGDIDYDSPSALDFDLLEEFLSDIYSGKAAKLPLYNFNIGKRYSESKDFVLENDDIIIFEGIQTLYPEFTELFKNIKSLSIYASVDSEFNIGDKTISPRNIRFFRRIVRDFKFRNSPPMFSIYLWESVVENEDKHILPFSDNVDIKINSALGYELSAIKNDLLNVVSTIPEDSIYRYKTYELYELFENIEPISPDYIPKNSLFREFIGK